MWGVTKRNKKMKKNIITLIAVIIAVSATAQNNQLTYPATYVETVVDAATLQELSREFSVDRVKRNADNTFSTRISLSYKDFDNFLSKQIP